MLYLFRIISNAEMSAVWYAIHQLDRVFNLLNRPIRVQARRPLLSGRDCAAVLNFGIASSASPFCNNAKPRSLLASESCGLNFHGLSESRNRPVAIPGMLAGKPLLNLQFIPVRLQRDGLPQLLQGLVISGLCG